MLAERPRVVQGVQSPTGGVVPSVVFGLSVSNREFTSWESDGSNIQGEYEIEVSNGGPVPSPVALTGVTVDSNEEELNLIDNQNPDTEVKNASPGGSVTFTVSFDVDAGSGSSTAREGCDGEISCQTEEVVAARILGATYTSDGDVNVSSTDCSIGGVTPDPVPDPDPQPEPEPEPPGDGDGGDDGDDGGRGGAPACGEGEGEIEGPTIVVVDEDNEWNFTGNVDACNDQEHRLIWDMSVDNEDGKEYGGRFGRASVTHAYEFQGPKTIEFRIESQATDEVLYSTQLDITVEDPTTGGLRAGQLPSMSQAASQE